MTTTTILFILLGGFAGGFVSGLTGFGTGITALVFWLYVLPPAVASPLVVVCSVIGQVQTLPKIWHAIDFKRVMPFIVGGLAGVPVGTYLLVYLTSGTFKIGVGILLVCYCSFMLIGRIKTKIAWGGRPADATVGFGAGILGGLAGVSGPPVTIWSGLRGWEKDPRRAVLQSFNLTILTFALISQAVAGFMSMDLMKATIAALPGTVTGAWLGRCAYDRLSDARFAQVILVVLLLSGVMLIYTGVK